MSDLALPSLYPLTVRHVCSKCGHTQTATYLNGVAQRDWTVFHEVKHAMVCDGMLSTLAPAEDEQIDPARTYAALHTNDGGRTWSQHAVCSGQQALDSLARSTDPASLRFVDLP